MIKQPFFAFTRPKLTYDIAEPDPKEPKQIPLFSNLILLINDSIDNSKEALLKIGDRVEKGEKLYLYKDSKKYALSPAPGTIKKIDSYSGDFGGTATCLVISTDPGRSNEPDAVRYDFKDTVISAGEYLKTLPGAPPLEILADPDLKIDAIIISCADPDLLSTTRQYMALKFMDDIKEGIQVLKRISHVRKFYITLPENLNLKKEIDFAKIIRTSNIYPSNMAPMILKDHLNTVLPAKKKPEDVGFCFMTAEAVVSLAHAYQTQTACHEKLVTVIDKQSIPHRVMATIGTPLQRIFNTVGIHIHEQDRIIIGGPMTGFATYTAYHPVQPDMDTVIVQDRDKIPELSDNPCVNCGKCIRVCPVHVPVNILVRYLEAGLYEDATDRYDLFSCIDCGLCAYVCTARIPIYQYIRLGKYEMSKQDA